MSLNRNGFKNFVVRINMENCGNRDEKKLQIYQKGYAFSLKFI